jgi:hypothetical protein
MIEKLVNDNATVGLGRKVLDIATQAILLISIPT